MQHVHQQVRLAGRDRISEEITSYRGQSVGRRPDALGYDVREIKQYAGDSRRHVEDGFDQVASAPADVHDAAAAGEVVRLDHRLDDVDRLRAIAS